MSLPIEEQAALHRQATAKLGRPAKTPGGHPAHALNEAVVDAVRWFLRRRKPATYADFLKAHAPIGRELWREAGTAGALMLGEDGTIIVAPVYGPGIVAAVKALK